MNTSNEFAGLAIPGRLSLRILGKVFLYIYIIISYVSCSEIIPSALNTLSLYALIGVTVLYAIYTHFRAINNRYFIWYFVFLISSVISALFAEMLFGYDDWWGSVYQIIVCLVLCFALLNFVENKYEVKQVGIAYIIGAVLLFLLLYVTNSLHAESRLGEAVMGNANTFATMYMTALIYAIWLAVFTKKIHLRAVLYTAIGVIFYALLLSGGRKFIIAPLIFLYGLLILKTDKRGRRKIIKATFISGGIVAIVWILIMNNPMLYEIIGYRFVVILRQLSGETISSNASSFIRARMIELAYKGGWSSPVWGHGFDTFKYLCKEQLGRYQYSHNNWTEMWYNGGVIGIVIYYYMYLKIAFQGRNLLRSDQEAGLFSIAGIISIFIFEYGGVTYCTYPIQMIICLMYLMTTFKIEL